MAIPILDEVNSDTYGVYVINGQLLEYHFVDPNEKKSQDYINALRSMASKYHGKVNFVWINATKFGDHAKALNLVEEKWPSFIVQNLELQSKYPYDWSKDVEAAAVSSMVADYLDDKLMPKLKSLPHRPRMRTHLHWSASGLKRSSLMTARMSLSNSMHLGMSDVSSW